MFSDNKYAKCSKNVQGIVVYLQTRLKTEWIQKISEETKESVQMITQNLSTFPKRNDF